MYGIRGKPWEKIEKATEAHNRHLPAPTRARQRLQQQEQHLLPSHESRGTASGASTTRSQIWLRPAQRSSSRIIQRPAKVVIMQSRFEPWWRSVRSGVLDPIFGRSLGLNMFLTKIPPVMSTRKQILGLFEVHSSDEIDESKARAAYKRHFWRA
ncbi:hypothetical protein PG985_012719 [Apiospora marii]|uniref:uncharacterized protein n=1 Tax=Apiospora marii TaxID=335849 RepID=UPI0031301FC7